MNKFIVLILLFTSTTVHAEWKSNSEIGFVSQSGNAEQENAFIKTEITDKYEKGELQFNGEYINSSGQTGDGSNTTLAESALAKLQYTYGGKDHKFGPFVSALWEKNRFAGFDNRYAGDAGIRYQIIDTEKLKLRNETGYRFRQQFAATIGDARGEETESQFGRVYFGLERILTKTASLKFFIETLYDFTDSENIEVIFEPSMNVAIGEFFSSEERPAQVSLNVSYRGIFDNVPAQDGFERYDSILSTGIKVIY
jgi:putative salt-induced outer membrane protein YdiY